MSSRARTLLLAILALTGVGALALGALALRDLHAVAATLADPAPVIEQVVDRYLAAMPSQSGPRADDPLLGERKIFVTAKINEYTAKDVAARLLYLNGRDARRPIDLYLSTEGGWVDSAFTIIDVMNLIDAPVNTWAIGGCYSAGALILAAGTGTRFATSNAMLMIHASLDEVEDSEQPSSYERLALERYERIWRERAALPDDWFPMVGGEEHYLSPQDALRFKLIDAIVPADDPTHHTAQLEGSPP